MKDEKQLDFEFIGLRKIYDNIHILNTSITERMRVANKADASANLIILLELFAKFILYVIDESLGKFRYLFESYLIEK